MSVSEGGAQAAPKKIDEMKLIILVGIIAVIGGGIYFLFFKSGPQGTWRYKVCDVFLELSVTYPDTLDRLYVFEKQMSASIVYTVINPYGFQTMDTMECFFSLDERTNTPTLSRVTINEVPQPDEEIETFNTKGTITSIIMGSDPDLTLPKPASGSLEGLRREKAFK